MDKFLNGELPQIITINRRCLVNLGTFIIIINRKYNDESE